MTQRADEPIVCGAPQTRVVISNLKRDVDEEALAALCRQLGRVTNFRLTPGHSPDSPITAIVEYASPEEARDVVNHVDGRLILGQPVTASVTVSGASYRQSSTTALPPGIPPPQGANNSTPAPAGQAHAPYPSGIKDPNVDHAQGKDSGPPPYARYPPPHRSEPPRQFQSALVARAPPWKRGPPGQDHRAPPQTAFGNGYPHGQQQSPWAGHPMRENPADSGPRFGNDGHHHPPAPDSHNPRVSAQQWKSRGEMPRENEYMQWERDGRRGCYPTQRSNHVEQPEFQRHSSSPWPGGPDACPPVPLANGAGTGPRVGSSESIRPPGAAPHGLRSGNGYVDGDPEDVSVGKRRRTSPPSGGRGPPGPSHSTSDWREGPRNPAPPPESAAAEPTPNRNPDFDREVMRQAVLLVAERELRAREGVRKQTNEEPVLRDKPELQQHHSRQAREKPAGVNQTNMGHRRSRSAEDGDRRKREGHGSRERRQRDWRDGDPRSGRNAERGFDQVPRDWREENKRSRRDDDSPHRGSHGHVDERAGKVRAEGMVNERRAPSDRKYPEDNGGSGSRRREDDKWNHRDRKDEHRAMGDSRNRTSNSSKEPERVGSRGDKLWERGSKQGHPPEGEGRRRQGSRESALGPSLQKNWEQSSADTGWYVHVGGISFSTTFTTLAKRFAAFGDVNGFKVIFNNVTCRAADDGVVGGGGNRDRPSKKDPTKAAVVTASTGFAFISFDDEEGMERAIECMDNQVLDGHVLKVSRGRMLSDSFAPKPRPPAVKADRRWPQPDGNQDFRHHNPRQQQQYHSPPLDRADRRPAPAINSPPSPSAFQKRSGTGAGSSSGVPGHANFRHRNGDRRDARDASGRSRHNNEDVFGGYGGVAGAQGGGGGAKGKPKRDAREGDDGSRERARFGGNGHTKPIHKRAKEEVNDGARPRNGLTGSAVP